MELFNTLLEIKTGKKDLSIKAIFIDNALYGAEGAYFIYHYDVANNTFYINDLNYVGTENRTSAINIIEHIVTKAYQQELRTLNANGVKNITIQKPKVFCFYMQRTGNVIIDKVTLKTVKGEHGKILGFKQPSWNNKDTNAIKLKKLHKNLMDFYDNTEIESV